MVEVNVIKRLLPDWMARTLRRPSGAEPTAVVKKSTRVSIAPHEITVRPWQPGDTERINTFYNDPRVRPGASSPDCPPRTEEQWRWEFEAPAAGDARYVLAFHGDRIVGLQGYIPIPLRCDGKLIRSGKSEDTLVHPDYRGLGIGDRMYERLFDIGRHEGVELIWGFTTTAVNLLRRNGFQFLMPFDVMQSNVTAALAACASGTAAGQQLGVVDFERGESRCDRFSEDFAESTGGLGIDLSARFLKWRLLDNPFRRYHTLIALHQGGVVGLAAIKCEPLKKLAYLSELAVMETRGFTRTQVANGLLQVGLQRIRDEGYSNLQARPAGPHPYNQSIRSVLADLGFEHGPSNNLSQFAVRPLSDRILQSLRPEQWRLGEIMREF